MTRRCEWMGREVVNIKFNPGIMNKNSDYY